MIERTLQGDVGAWIDATFPHGSAATAYAHLCDEVRELGEAVHSVEGGGAVEHTAEELADCCLLLLSIAHHLGIDLEAEAARKLAVNREREWGAPDHRGVARHVQPDP